ncbi:MAG: hypothetical protein ACREEM_30415 [Blastocatellia bacterium]
MSKAIQFPYTITNPALGESSSLPYLPFTLQQQQQHTISATGLVDSGATVNVLPFSIGLQLGLNWARQTVPVQLTGNLARFEARGVIVAATVGTFAPVRLAFAWTASDEVPALLGQMNFFLEFDVCFFRSQSLFEIKPKP